MFEYEHLDIHFCCLGYCRLYDFERWLVIVFHNLLGELVISFVFTVD